MKCGERKLTSAVCTNGGNNPKWADSFSLVKKESQDILIEFFNMKT